MLLTSWKRVWFAYIASFWMAFAGAAAPLPTVNAIDVPRYMGNWYEIAKFPNWFQRKCVGNTQAQYALQSDGSLRVTNRCKLASGQMDEAVGAARQIGNASSPKLQVRFAPQWLSIIAAVWGDYWVIALDDNYQWVAVSEPGREYLWVLSRTPRMDAQTYANLLLRLSSLGLDVQKLELTPQD
jgi:apolipoprotein D and lipocalin family protein